MKTLDARLCLLFTPSLCRADPWRTLQDAIAGGVDLVQWRVKARDAAGAARCGLVCRDAGVPWIVNDDVDLAVELEADGAHVGQDDLDAARARETLGAARALGVSTHDRAQILAAIASGADYLGFGPMFPTATKGYDAGQPDGALRDALATAGPVPIFAIGGITAANIGRVTDEGASRVAVCSEILSAGDPGAAARAIRRALDGQSSSIASPNE